MAGDLHEKVEEGEEPALFLWAMEEGLWAWALDLASETGSEVEVVEYWASTSVRLQDDSRWV